MTVQSNLSLIQNHLNHEEYDSALIEINRLPPSKFKNRFYALIKQEADYFRDRGKKLFDLIASGKSNFKIWKIDKLYKKKVLNCFELLLTKETGQNLIERIIKRGTEINIIPSKEITVQTVDGAFQLKFNTDISNRKHLTSDSFRKVNFRHSPEYIALVHELCHINNHLNGTLHYALKFKDDAWENGEEKYAITGKLSVNGRQLLPPTVYCENWFRWLFHLPTRINHESISN